MGGSCGPHHIPLVSTVTMTNNKETSMTEEINWEAINAAEEALGIPSHVLLALSQLTDYNMSYGYAGTATPVEIDKTPDMTDDIDALDKMLLLINHLSVYVSNTPTPEFPEDHWCHRTFRVTAADEFNRAWSTVYELKQNARRAQAERVAEVFDTAPEDA